MNKIKQMSDYIRKAKKLVHKLSNEPTGSHQRSDSDNLLNPICLKQVDESQGLFKLDKSENFENKYLEAKYRASVDTNNANNEAAQLIKGEFGH